MGCVVTVSRADDLYTVLAKHPGMWIGRTTMFRMLGRYFLTNNAASEARAKYGVTIGHTVKHGEHFYRLEDAK